MVNWRGGTFLSYVVMWLRVVLQGVVQRVMEYGLDMDVE